MLALMDMGGGKLHMGGIGFDILLMKITTGHCT